MQALLEALGEPIVTASVPEGKKDTYASQVEEFLDGGEIEPQQTTVVDLSEGLGGLRVLRIGAGSIEELAPFLSVSEAFQEA